MHQWNKVARMMCVPMVPARQEGRNPHVVWNRHSLSSKHSPCVLMRHNLPVLTRHNPRVVTSNVLNHHVVLVVTAAVAAVAAVVVVQVGAVAAVVALAVADN